MPPRSSPPAGPRDASPVLERAIPTGQLSDWLVTALPRLSTPLSVDVLGGGHSNVTVLVRDAAGKRVVLRRPPLGAQPRGAHDVLREARVMTAAGSQGIPVPEVLATCAGGFSTADQLLERHVARSQRRVDHLEYHRAFSWWRMAVIAEGIRRRYDGGAMAASVDLDHVDSRVEWLAELADAHLRAHGA
jgi:aminoglycoside phosphotransferase (APT) family kinase protein